jgi:succinoglycan biosynthesis transport protein ExoP
MRPRQGLPESERTALVLPAPPDKWRFASEPEDLDLSGIWGILWKRRWTVIACMAGMFALALAASLIMTPKYEAVAVIEVNRENSDMLGLDHPEGVAGGLSDTLDYSITQQTVASELQSDSLTLQVTEQRGLEKREDSQGWIGVAWDWMFGSPSANEDSLPLERAPLRRRKIHKMFENNLKIKIVPGTRLIEVYFRSPKPQLAADVANTLVNDYLEMNFREHYAATAQASDWLSKQLADLKSQVEESQEKLNVLKIEAGIMGADETNNVVTAKLEELNKQLTAAEANRILKETVYHLAQSGNAELISSTAGSNLIGSSSGSANLNQLAFLQSLREKEADLKGQYAQAASKYGPAYPKVVQLDNQLKDLEASIQSEIQKLAARVQNDYLAARDAENLLRASFDRQKAEANKLNDKAIQYTILKREVESGRKLYDDSLTRLKDAGVLASLRSSKIIVVDPARTPAKPARPNYPLNLGLGLVVGLLGGIALAFMREGQDDAIYTPKQMEMISALPLLGIVPELASGMDSYHLRYFKRQPDDCIMLTHPSSQMAEAYRSLRTSMLLSNVGPPPKVIVITSPLPQEGKTITSLNLAIALAQQELKVLLIDADLRRPALHHRLKMSSAPGLAEFLAARNGAKPELIQYPQVPNLLVLHAGDRPDTPAELLGSKRMGEFLESLREQFDFILIDTPPVLAVTDAVVLSIYADAVVLVVRSNRTTKQALLRASDALVRANANIMVLVNGVNTKSLDYYQYYGHRGSKWARRYLTHE